jgi:hypothetical protein
VLTAFGERSANCHLVFIENGATIRYVISGPVNPETRGAGVTAGEKGRTSLAGTIDVSE